MVSNTSELLPEPETPVKTVSRRFGSSTLTSLRLFTRAPCTRIRSWVSATCMRSRRTARREIDSEVAGLHDRLGARGHDAARAELELDARDLHAAGARRHGVADPPLGGSLVGAGEDLARGHV